jgi:hypothetical protein
MSFFWVYINSFNIKFLLSSLIFLISESSFSSEITSYDLNRDGIKDRFEHKKNKTLILIEEDRNGDKKIDFKIILNDPKFFRIELQDTNFDGKFERKKSFLSLENSKTLIRIEKDLNEDGIYELQYDEIKSNLEKESCSQDDSLDQVVKKIQELKSVSLEAISATEEGFLPTGIGYRVESECYKKWGVDFNEVLQDVAVNGLLCLEKLHKSQPKDSPISGALRNAFEISKLYENDQISLMCSLTDYNWSETRAFASTTTNKRIVSKNVSHPYIALNPNFPEAPAEDRDKEIARIKNTIFHETLHNLGFLHEESIEYSYTCGLCCFDKDASKELTESACKICTGNYKNETDLNYIKDLLVFTELNYQRELGSAAVIKFMKENPQSTLGASLLAVSNSNIFNPLGSKLADIIQSRNPVLTEEVRDQLKNAKRNEGSPTYSLLPHSISSVSESLYQLYFKQDGAEALEVLNQNKDKIKQELELAQNSSSHEKWVGQHATESLKKILKDMWIYGFPGGSKDSPTPQSHKAYELYSYFNF